MDQEGDCGGGNVDVTNIFVDGVTSGVEGMEGEKSERSGEVWVESGFGRQSAAHGGFLVRDAMVPQGRGDVATKSAMKEYVGGGRGESGSRVASSPAFLVLLLLLAFVLFSTFLLLRTRKRRNAPGWGRYF